MDEFGSVRFLRLRDNLEVEVPGHGVVGRGPGRHLQLVDRWAHTLHAELSPRGRKIYLRQAFGEVRVRPRGGPNAKLVQCVALQMGQVVAFTPTEEFEVLTVNLPQVGVDPTEESPLALHYWECRTGLDVSRHALDPVSFVGDQGDLLQRLRGSGYSLHYERDVVPWLCKADPPVVENDSDLVAAEMHRDRYQQLVLRINRKLAPLLAGVPASEIRRRGLDPAQPRLLVTKHGHLVLHFDKKLDRWWVD